MIKIENINKSFDHKNVLANVSLEIPKGSIYGIIGYSGAGKSTLVRIINALEKPDSGKVFIDNTDLYSLDEKTVRDEKKKIGMIFQHFYLLNSKTVFDNVAIALKINKAGKNETESRVMEILKFVGLENYRDNYPEQLSGGQKQRIGIARALVNNPKILLCDEATSALDPETTKQILELLQKVNRELGVTIVLITHQMEVVKNICDRVAVLENGYIIEENDVFNIFAFPKEATTQKFVESILHQDIPDSAYRHLIDGRLYKLTFSKGHVDEPVLSNITAETGVNFSILQGVVTEIQEHFFGQLVVKLSSAGEQTDIALEKLKTYGVEVQEIGKGGNTI
ncbi:methionine ABC transporter ATP-binding protein [Sebaldella sp. S0638]|uniref:methionine ABC transporter ATP-binding protein n=1 Tax=Sebaldella sp. S0638 TaxID=2957809 RepID=UPI00209EE1AD|nr:ATP-binding cassette domain-containing protein [Sebaldella sp. S0638]MCP1224443.1 ATP-binding cassette domain-containing protein [Sebaldella sp. S0638]